LLVAHVRALNEYLSKHPLLDVSFLGTTEEEISNHWALLSDLIRSSLLKDSNTQGATNEERKDKRNKKKKQEGERNEDLKLECLHLVMLLCNLLAEEVQEVMADEEDDHSFLNVLSRLLRKGFIPEEIGKDEDENLEGHHSPRLHGEVLKSFAWLLFYADEQTQIVEFLQSSQQYFVFNKDIAEDIYSKNIEVMDAALQCWAFLLTSLNDDRIHDLFAPQ